MIVIINYSVGNIGSIINMFKRIGVKAKLSSDIEDIKSAEKLFLPGVGSFGHGMDCLKKSGLIDVIEDKVFNDKTPVMGVCLGMQMLLEHSEEGDCDGLGWIKGKVQYFQLAAEQKDIKIPHMGWNVIEPQQSSPLLNNFEDEARFYFAHSYHAVCESTQNILATTHHGYDFASVVSNGNIYGAQFHPEKSHKFGMQLLKNFAAMEI